jgi:hypothetical protein
VEAVSGAENRKKIVYCALSSKKNSPAARIESAFGACSEPFDSRPLTEVRMVRLPVGAHAPTIQGREQDLLRERERGDEPKEEEALEMSRRPTNVAS